MDRAPEPPRSPESKHAGNLESLLVGILANWQTGKQGVTQASGQAYGQACKIVCFTIGRGSAPLRRRSMGASAPRVCTSFGQDAGSLGPDPSPREPPGTLTSMNKTVEPNKNQERRVRCPVLGFCPRRMTMRQVRTSSVVCVQASYFPRS